MQHYPGTARFPERAARWERMTFSASGYKKLSYTATVRYSLPPPFTRLPELKIAFISDLHYTDSEKCRRIFDEIIWVLKAEKCDILFLGGEKFAACQT